MVGEEDSGYFAISVMAVDLECKRIVERLRQRWNDTYDERRLILRLQVRHDQEKHTNTVRLFADPVTAENKGRK